MNSGIEHIMRASGSVPDYQDYVNHTSTTTTTTTTVTPEPYHNSTPYTPVSITSVKTEDGTDYNKI